MRMELLVFFREGHFYPLEVPVPTGKTLKQVARDHAERNPGTIKVETGRGKTLWTRPPMH